MTSKKLSAVEKKYNDSIKKGLSEGEKKKYDARIKEIDEELGLLRDAIGRGNYGEDLLKRIQRSLKILISNSPKLRTLIIKCGKENILREILKNWDSKRTSNGKEVSKSQGDLIDIISDEIFKLSKWDSKRTSNGKEVSKSQGDLIDIISDEIFKLPKLELIEFMENNKNTKYDREKIDAMRKRRDPEGKWSI
ncbi:MAG: hypothetical protein J6T91_05015 [Alphaproteobacteria bacterium]|nr:hypothetical protein [Alphaproteobacteria bacterium]